MGKPVDPEYWVKWRAAHPEYRARQSRLRAERRKTKGREPRQAEYARRQARRGKVDTTPIPTLHQGHPLLRKAVELVSRWLKPDRRDRVYDPLYDDLVQEAVLALLLDKDPNVPVHDYMMTERQMRKLNLPLFEEHDDRDRSG